MREERLLQFVEDMLLLLHSALFSEGKPSSPCRQARPQLTAYVEPLTGAAVQPHLPSTAALNPKPSTQNPNHSQAKSLDEFFAQSFDACNAWRWQTIQCNSKASLLQ